MDTNVLLNFEKYKDKLTEMLISNGEGRRANAIVGSVSYADFCSGYESRQPEINALLREIVDLKNALYECEQGKEE